MELKSDTHNVFLKRKEMEFEIEAEKNPNFEEVRQLLSEKLKVPQENIHVHGINGNFGKKSFIISANVYDSKEGKEKFDVKTQKQRKADKESSKKAYEDKKKAEAEQVAGEEVSE